MTGPAHCHPDEGDTTWMNGPVNCRDHGTDVFFPKGKDHSRPRGAYDKALTICAGCPAQQPCLEYALRTKAQDGVWGGATPDQRKQMRRPAMRAESPHT
jgi:WhiB family redox-sensing transcriptional regulator